MSMKKYFLLLLVLVIALLISVACKSKTRPNTGGNIGNSPQTPDFGTQTSQAYDNFYDKLQDAFKDNGALNSKLSNAAVLKGGDDAFKKLAGKVLVSWTTGSSGGWHVLGVRSDGHNVNYYQGGGDLAGLIKKVGEDSQFDPRKLFYYINNDLAGKPAQSEASYQGNVLLSWLGRAAEVQDGQNDSGANDISRFGGYGSYDSSFGIVGEYKTISPKSIPRTGGTNIDTYANIPSLTEKKYDANMRLSQNATENSGKYYRQSWRYFYQDTDEDGAVATVFNNGDIWISHPRRVRFGYATNSKEELSDMNSLKANGWYSFANVVPDKDADKISTTENEIYDSTTKVLLLNPVGENGITATASSKYIKNGIPVGKTVFRRRHSGRYVDYLTTVVGYNVTLVEGIKPSELSVTKPEGMDEGKWSEFISRDFSIVVVEFPQATIYDAKFDGWGGNDLPPSGISTVNAIGSSGRAEIYTGVKVTGDVGGDASSKYGSIYRAIFLVVPPDLNLD